VGALTERLLGASGAPANRALLRGARSTSAAASEGRAVRWCARGSTCVPAPGAAGARRLPRAARLRAMNFVVGSWAVSMRSGSGTCCGLSWRPRGPRLRLFLGGDGPLRASLGSGGARDSRQGDDRRRLGAPGSVLPAFDLFVLASRNEGMGPGAGRGDGDGLRSWPPPWAGCRSPRGRRLRAADPSGRPGGESRWRFGRLADDEALAAALAAARRGRRSPSARAHWCGRCSRSTARCPSEEQGLVPSRLPLLPPLRPSPRMKRADRPVAVIICTRPSPNGTASPP